MIRRRKEESVAEPDQRTDKVLNRLETVVERLEALAAQRQVDPPPKPKP